MLSALEETALGKLSVPLGAYYILTDATALQKIIGLSNDSELARYLITTCGLATVPGSSFFTQTSNALSLLCFCYYKKPETLAHAIQKLPH